MRRDIKKRIYGYGHPAKILIRLRTRAVWSESSLGAFWIAKDAQNEYSDQTVHSVRWAHMSEGTCSHVAAHMLNWENKEFY